jgi:hypothetical protein
MPGQRGDGNGSRTRAIELRGADDLSVDGGQVESGFDRFTLGEPVDAWK